ncbi:ABC transporter substrate-binding protein [Nocardiopsis ansamitocini]|uniref:ABC transporter substrate-binding protein n=1 Tax=Nocardiopsis ansamitocini TaxID=1670832 RepID=A0A9W6P3H9_9ACTN|nr:ABC transporter substrate-binding protein [Nocardiopsis ansamitocini]GLU46604.1 ABC transporter substrate-binding protein [Nocardiopsis ansamitocini]
MRLARRLVALPLLATLSLTACGGLDPDDTVPDTGGTAQGSEGFPLTVADSRGEVTLDAAPERIVSLSPSATEMLFAVGAGDQVVAADEYSNYPEEAPTTDLSGFTPSVEAITEYDPDLVVMANDGEETVSQLEAVQIPVLLLPAAVGLDDTYSQLELLGEATGNGDEGTKAAEQLKTRIDGIVAEVEESGASDLTYYHEIDAAMYSVTSETFIGQVYSLFGLTNIADATEDTAGGYPQLSAEYIVEENPDLVFLSYPDGAQDFAERPAFDSVTAVEDGNVIELDADVSSRWGPRVADFAEDVAQAIDATKGQ